MKMNPIEEIIWQKEWNENGKNERKREINTRIKMNESRPKIKWLKLYKNSIPTFLVWDTGSTKRIIKQR